MSTDIPIPTISGILQGFEGQFLSVGRLTTGGQLTSISPVLIDPPAGGDCVLEVRTPAGSQQVTIPDGLTTPAAAVGLSLAYSAADLIEIGIVASNGARDLSGFIVGEPIAPTVGSTTLCTVADVKAFAHITDTASDSILGTIVSSVSQQIERWLGFGILQTAYSGELYSGGFPTVQPLHGPIEDINSVSVLEYGNAVDASELRLVDGGWTIGRFSQSGSAMAFSSGYLNIELAYTGGYSVLPADFNVAATMQSEWVWRQSGLGNNNLGITGRSESGGTSTAEYANPERGMLPIVAVMLDPYRSRF